jgi:[ribosomal protein S5]-alanine N-acetyltransferase
VVAEAIPGIRLLPITSALAEAIARDDGDSFNEGRFRFGEIAPLAKQVVDGALAMPAAPSPWGSYFTVADGTNQVIGTCAFKSAPNGEGLVEIAYYTFPGFEGRGYATAMAAALLEIAGQEKDVPNVIAHTLPERNASARLLERLGFRFAGDVIDPEDGPVWRWEMPASEVRRQPSSTAV